MRFGYKSVQRFGRVIILFKMLKILNPIIVISVFLLDRISKFLILKKLYFSEYKIFSFFSLRYVENTGIAFGLFQDRNLFFIISNTIFLTILIYVKRKFRDTFSTIGIHLVIGGALGNIYDRIAYKYVVDFIDFHFFPAVFNIADASITVGAFFIGISALIERIKEKKK